LLLSPYTDDGSPSSIPIKIGKCQVYSIGCLRMGILRIAWGILRMGTCRVSSLFDLVVLAWSYGDNT